MPRLAVPKKDLVFRNAKPAATVYQIGDGGGLSLQIKPNGSKLWIFRYQRPSGERNNLSFGPYPVVRVEKARDFAINARAPCAMESTHKLNSTPNEPPHVMRPKADLLS